jgi:2,5-dihydroxypyridine 5,6-dioxygenase
MRRLPLATQLSAELTPMFVRELELCNLKEGETLLIFSDSMFNPHYAAAFRGAAMMLGAEVVHMEVPHSTDSLASRTIVDAWKAADMVIPLTSRIRWLYSDAHNEALDSGTRTLMVQEPVDILRRLFPDEAVRRRTEAGAQLLTRAESMRIASEAGTDLSLDKTGRPGIGQHGIADVPGRWDHWPSGLVACAPVEGSVEGIFVLDRGDIILNLGRHVESPVRFTLKEGRVVEIEGGTDARLLKDLFAQANDDKAYVVSHIGWGTEHRAQWHLIATRFFEGGGGMDAESFYGNMQIAFGSNFGRFLGGENKVSFHLDLPTRNHSIWVDDELIVDRGVIVPEELQ